MITLYLWILFVELERFELSSKQGTNALSTCLSLPSIFVFAQDQSHQCKPYPLNFICTARPVQTISDITAPPVRIASDQQHPGDVSSPPPWAAIKLDLL